MQLISAIAVAPQRELNSREGAWERLCTERDPVVLSTLMWSWLEQLKEPIITKEDVETLAGNQFSPQGALNSIDKVAKTWKSVFIAVVLNFFFDAKPHTLSETIFKSPPPNMYL